MGRISLFHFSLALAAFLLRDPIVSSWEAESDLLPCRESVCGPRVSKCLLIKSCNCSMTPDDLKQKNCSCCKDCVQCLDDLFVDCCSCVGLCKPKKGLDPRLAMKSLVFNLDPDEDETGLFKTLTTENPLDPTHPKKWTVETFPALQDDFFYKNRNGTKIDQDRVMELWKDVNCTVAFMHECVSSEKCQGHCRSMGASSYRWFYTGCCECVGEDCLNYGSREANCRDCGELEELDGKEKVGELHREL